MAPPPLYYKKMKELFYLISAGIALFMISCKHTHTIRCIVSSSAFEGQVNGQSAHLYILQNGSGMQAAITNYGGRLVSLLVPDKNNQLTDVVVGFDSLQGYTNSSEPYFGATIGRYGNRIAKGQLVIGNKQFQLSVNNGPNTLHGGKNGFQYQVWDAKQLGDSTLELTYLSKDGEEGFPGNLSCLVTYTLTWRNELKIHYEATTDQPTPVNLTNHAFFNLNGAGSGTINNHQLYINADNYTPVDSTLIPTGSILTVRGSVFDFRRATAIGARINDADNSQLKYGKGYDHNYALNQSIPAAWTKAAVVTGDQSAIQMTILTTEPGLQFYSGNFMQGKNRLRNGRDDFRTAFCLETQHFPDSPNQPGFPNTVLQPGETYQSSSVYQFAVQP
jgi:aldose 1-epimerase